MKRSLINLIGSALLLGFGWLIPHSVFEVTLETATPILATALPTELPAAALSATALSTESPAAALPAASQPAAPERDPYGELYFTIAKAKEYYPPATPPAGIIEETLRLVRLPGSCVVGLIECPAVEDVLTPFDMKDVLEFYDHNGALIWSPDGRYGLLVIHPEDDITRGGTSEEKEQLKRADPKDLEISASTLYLFDAEEDTWREIYRAERKFFYSVHWSADGQWIAFAIATSLVMVHPLQAEDGFYVVHPDGSGLQRLGGNGGYILGWVGNSLLIQRFANPASGDFSQTIEMLTSDGQATPLFESSRRGNYALAPDGGALIIADSQAMDGHNPLRAIDLLALDGSVIRSFGTFLDGAATHWNPIVWSSDGTLAAFAHSRRVYVAPRVSQMDLPAGLVGVPPETREVYAASDQFSTPSFLDFEFSSDNQYLLMNVYEGFVHFVTVALDTGQVIPLDIPDMDPYTDANYLGDPGLFSWRP